jgi:tetratricopeptide (TPR) repeat protein
LLAYFQLDFGKAQSLDLESLGMFKELGDDEGVASVLNNLGDVVRHQGELSIAHSFYEQSTAISRKLMDQWGLAYAFLGIADVAREQGDLSRASSIYKECLVMFQKGTDHVGLPFALESVAALMIAKDQLKKSAQIFGVADALRKNTNSPLPLPNLASYQKNISLLHEKLDGSEFDAAWQEGLTMTVAQAIEFALEETGE